MRTGVQCLMDGLKQAGVEVIFGIPGGAVLDIFNDLCHAPFEFFLARHEQGAAHMADGYARATGRTGCCLSFHLAAILLPVGQRMRSIPLVCITGQVSSNMIGNDLFRKLILPASPAR